MHGSITGFALIANRKALMIACREKHCAADVYRLQALFLEKTRASGRETTSSSSGAQGCFTA